MNNELATAENLTAALIDARARTLALVEGLSEQQLTGPVISTVNPLRWEIAHAAYFHEFWVLRHLGKRQAIRPDVDALFDSISIPHADRWQLPLPDVGDTFTYMDEVLQAELAQLKEIELNDTAKYFYLLALYHEDMHGEAFTCTRQTLGYPKPGFIRENKKQVAVKPLVPEDIDIPGGTFKLGAERDGEFIFDNEKWAHRVTVAAFKVAKYAVSNEEYLEFVEAGGYQNEKYWNKEGWKWRCTSKLEQPIYWKKDPDQKWYIRQFDQWKPLEFSHAVVHVSWYEAQAFCNWAQRRLPTEIEWEFIAACDPGAKENGVMQKRIFPWGANLYDNHTNPNGSNSRATNLRENHANLDSKNPGTIEVNAHQEGDSAFGCRQMLGNVWEWTDSTFFPYPGFSPDGYTEYSRPLFGQTKVLRGGAWATRSRMLRNTWRNYYGPDRNDVFAGFRTCAR